MKGEVTATIRGIEATVPVDVFRSVFTFAQGYTYRECVHYRRLVTADLRTVSRFSAKALFELKCIDVRLADLRAERRAMRKRSKRELRAAVAQAEAAFTSPATLAEAGGIEAAYRARYQARKALYGHGSQLALSLEG